jgi:hypothetical protein
MMWGMSGMMALMVLAWLVVSGMRVGRSLETSSPLWLAAAPRPPEANPSYGYGGRTVGKRRL